MCGLFVEKIDVVCLEWIKTNLLQLVVHIAKWMVETMTKIGVLAAIRLMQWSYHQEYQTHVIRVMNTEEKEDKKNEDVLAKSVEQERAVVQLVEQEKALQESVILTSPLEISAPVLEILPISDMKEVSSNVSLRKRSARLTQIAKENCMNGKSGVKNGNAKQPLAEKNNT